MAELIDQNYPDTFVCELSRIERLGSNRRLVFTVPSVEENGLRSIVAKLIVSAEYLPTVVNLLAREVYDGQRTGVDLDQSVLKAFESNVAN